METICVIFIRLPFEFCLMVLLYLVESHMHIIDDAFYLSTKILFRDLVWTASVSSIAEYFKRFTIKSVLTKR